MDYYSLTAPQQNIWNLQKYYEQTPIGNIAGMITFKQNAAKDIQAALQYAIDSLVANADALRIRLTNVDGIIRQYVSEHETPTISLLDCSEKTDNEVTDYLQQEAEKPFDMLNQSLCRFSIVKRNNEYSVFMVIHHLICDGWSANLLANLLSEYVCQYDAGIRTAQALPSYKVFIQEQEKYRHARRWERDDEYWEQFTKAATETSFIKPKMPEKDAICAERYIYNVSAIDSAKIYSFCKQNGISPDVLYKSALAIYLFKLNHVQDVVMGTPVLNRDGMIAKQTAGMFVSTMPFRLNINDKQSVKDVMEQCVDMSSALFRHCKYPFSDIQAKAKKHCTDGSRLFDVMISYENSSINCANIAAVQWLFNKYSENTLVVHIDDRNGDECLDIACDYQVHNFRTVAEVELLAKRIQYIVEQIMVSDSLLVSEVKVIPDEEFQRIVYEFNDTASPYPRDTCVHELFCEQVVKTPNKTAVMCDNRALTYRELDHMSNNLAVRLQLKVGEVVALHMHRSEMILVTQLAVLKSGGIFLPIDLSVPTERIEDMLEDCHARYIIVSNEEKNFTLRNTHIEFLNIDEVVLDKEHSAVVEAQVTAEMGAHIIYTSGSTGKPKGSVLTHRGLVNFAYHNLVIEPGKCEYDNSISINTISFDMFMCETITPLITGITVHIATESQQVNQELFAKYVKEHNIQILQTTPTRYKILTSNKDNLDYLNSFKAMLLSGEPFSSDIYHEMRTNSNAHIYNTCGPSENHIWICGCELFSDDITLGYPVRNTQIYILDEQLQVLPIGVPGELCVSGDCIGLGYLNRPELNKEKYVPHPFFKDRVLYRTGDLAIFRPDGVIEPLGRIDSQVKIRGFRVELGEIESNICSFSGISNAAVVVVKHDGKEFLCAFYQSKHEVDEANLKDTLGKTLPNYMIPNLFIRVDAFPMTSSGKIARSNLAKYDISGLTVSEEFVEPTTKIEKELCAEFQRLLGIDRVSCNLDFFTAGGNSIHVIDMLSHLPSEYQLSAKDVYDHPTPKALAAYIEGQRESSYESLSCLVKASKKQLIFCFPFAGSDDSTFMELSVAIHQLMPHVSVYGLKHANWNEVSFEKAIEEIADLAEMAEDVFFYSHCAGSAMALKVYQNMKNQSKVKHIVIGANVPPRFVRLYGTWFTPWMLMNDEKVLGILNRAGMETTGISGELRKKLIAQFRIDTKCYFSEMASLEGGIQIPCTVIVSDADRFTPNIKAVQPSWNQYFSKPVEMVVLNDANHYFHKYRASEVAGLIRRMVIAQ